MTQPDYSRLSLFISPTKKDWRLYHFKVRIQIAQCKVVCMWKLRKQISLFHFISMTVNYCESPFNRRPMLLDHDVWLFFWNVCYVCLAGFDFTCLGCAAPPPSRHCSDSLAALSIDGGGGGVEWGAGQFYYLELQSALLPAATCSSYLALVLHRQGECHTKHPAALEGPQSTINRSHARFKTFNLVWDACKSGWLPMFTCLLGKHVNFEATQTILSSEQRSLSCNSCANTQAHFDPVLIQPQHSLNLFRFQFDIQQWHKMWQFCWDDVRVKQSLIQESLHLDLIHFPCWKEARQFMARAAHAHTDTDKLT